MIRQTVRLAAGLAGVLACAGPVTSSNPAPSSSSSSSSSSSPSRVLAARAYRAISLDGLADGIRHYRNKNGAGYPRYAPEQVSEIANNLLLYQRTNGGWVENQDPTRILTAGEQVQFTADKSKAGISFDNRNVFSQIEYLAEVFAQTGEARHRDAALRGLDLMLAHQVASCGGWPHTVPGRESYHPHITIADEVTTGVLTVLRKIAAGAGPFAFTGPPLRERARAAVERGDACLLRLQIVQRGIPTGWAGQYDRDTLQPRVGRSYELPAIVSQESVEVVRYLMNIENPSPGVRRAVVAAGAWLERSKLTAVRLETVAAEPVKYKFHSSTTDRRLIEDASAPPLWARFYDLDDNSVVLANRDGQRVAQYADIARERRTGYSWYGDWPARLLAEECPAWRVRVNLPALAAPAKADAPATTEWRWVVPRPW